MKDPEFDAVVHEAAESLVGRTAFRFAGYFSTAWESSALVGAVREWTAPFQYWPLGCCSVKVVLFAARPTPLALSAALPHEADSQEQAAARSAGQSG